MFPGQSWANVRCARTALLLPPSAVLSGSGSSAAPLARAAAHSTAGNQLNLECVAVCSVPNNKPGTAEILECCGVLRLRRKSAAGTCTAVRQVGQSCSSSAQLEHTRQPQGCRNVLHTKPGHPLHLSVSTSLPSWCPRLLLLDCLLLRSLPARLPAPYGSGAGKQRLVSNNLSCSDACTASMPAVHWPALHGPGMCWPA